MVDRPTDRRREAHAPVAPPGDRGHRSRQPQSGHDDADRRREQERYRVGTRRTGAEPLEASWQPAAQESDGAPESPQRGAVPRVRRWVATYGWRVYALPILLVLTVIVVVDTSGGDGADSDTAPAAVASDADGDGNADGPPAATEQPAQQEDLDIPTAELPEGGSFTENGDGSWQLIDGESDAVGDDGELYRYVIEVEEGIDSSSFGGDEAFASLVDGTLSDPRGWTGDDKVRFERVADPEAADFRVSLTSSHTVRRPDVCGYTIEYEASCYRSSMDRVVINLARWVRGAKAFSSDMLSYRQYAINHEVGHALGNGHVGCDDDDELAPVMMQQSFGVANDYVAQLNGADPRNYDAVPEDGKVCKPNAWPNPSAQ